MRAGVLAVVGFGLTLALVATGFDDLITRNIIALWLPAAIFVSGGLAVERWRPVGVSVAIALCVIGLVATIGIAADRAMQRPDWRPVARVLGQRRLPAGVRVIDYGIRGMYFNF